MECLEGLSKARAKLSAVKVPEETRTGGSELGLGERAKRAALD
jgi:hypothetical protein